MFRAFPKESFICFADIFRLHTFPITETETLNVSCGVTDLPIAQNVLFLFCEIVRLLALITVSIDILHILNLLLVRKYTNKNHKHIFFSVELVIFTEITTIFATE